MRFEISCGIKRPLSAAVLQAVQSGLKALYPEVIEVKQGVAEAVTVVLAGPVDRPRRVSIRRDASILIHQAAAEALAAASPPQAQFLQIQQALKDRAWLIALDEETFVAAGELAVLIERLDDRIETLWQEVASAAPVVLPAVLPATLISGIQAVKCEPSALTGSKRALSHAACLPVYPAFAGAALSSLLVTTARVACVRKESCVSWPVLTEYNVRELVLIGAGDEVAETAGRLFDLLLAFFQDLKAPVHAVAATDSFLGENAQAALAFQQLMGTKTEICIPDESGAGRLALASLNFHGTAFTRPWKIACASGGLAESACIGVGLERAACAFLHSHGLQAAAWPQFARAALGL